MKILQIIFVFLNIWTFLNCLYYACNGRKASAPMGFGGILITIIIYFSFIVFYYYAGFYNALIK
jgi:hypothetical protein